MRISNLKNQIPHLNFVCSIPSIKVNLTSMHKPANAHLKSCYICPLFLAPTCCGHNCDHLQSVLQYKYQEYNRNPVKCVIELYKVVQICPGQTVTCLHTNSPGHI
jgi:hypothetical protein